MPDLILASESIARQTLLKNAGLNIAVSPARIDEEAIRAGLSETAALPRDVADVLAEAKARKVSSRHAGSLVLGCDQVLGFDKKVMSKSPSREDAATLLTHLSGKRHQLFSAAVLYGDGKPLWRHVGVASLTMRTLSSAFIDAYLDRNWAEVRDSVGCYHLEAEGVRLFQKIEGDYFSVLGLPLVELLSYLTLTGEIEG